MDILFWQFVAGIFIILFLYQMQRVKKVKIKLKRTSYILDDIIHGNLDRRLLDDDASLTSEVCFKINQIIMSQKERNLAQGKAEAAYRQLVTSLSHDLRTPLASISGHLEALANGLVSESETISYMQIAIRKANELKEYVDILFDWTKLESGEKIFHFERVDICESTRAILTSWMIPMEEAGFKFNIQIPEEEKFGYIDMEAYKRILGNLLNNVLKHSGGNKCGISLKEETDRFKIVISDNGKGIPAEHLEHVFMRLYKGDASRSAGGSGLGLSIVQELVKAHQGKISVESIPMQKTSFIIYLPLA